MLLTYIFEYYEILNSRFALEHRYESAIKAPATNLVYGSLVHMLLIQVQFLKYEILQSMEKVDLLVKANHKNIELAATVFFFSICFSLSLSKTFISLNRTSHTGSSIYSRYFNVLHGQCFVQKDISSRVSISICETCLENSVRYRADS